MFNKKLLLSLVASVVFATSCMGATELNDTYLKQTNDILNGKIERVDLDFKTDGRAGTETYWIMTKEQFETLKKLIEYAVVGYKVIGDEAGTEHIVFTGELGFERNKHLCGIKKPSLFKKIILCIKQKNIDPFIKNPYIHVADADTYTHVAIKASLKVNPFNVVNVKARIYPNVPAGSAIGNLPGIYLRGNGKTKKTGDLVGFSYRAEKDGHVEDYFFGQLWKE